jgi:hypothetical protein
MGCRLFIHGLCVVAGRTVGLGSLAPVALLEIQPPAFPAATTRPLPVRGPHAVAKALLLPRRPIALRVPGLYDDFENFEQGGPAPMGLNHTTLQLAHATLVRPLI